MKLLQMVGNDMITFRKDVLVRHTDVYTLTLEKTATDFYHVIATTGKRSIVRARDVTHLVAVELYERILIQKQAEQFTIETSYETKRPTSIETMMVNPAPSKAPEDMYFQEGNFAAVGINAGSKRVLMSFGVFNPGYIEIFTDTKELIASREKRKPTEEFLLEGYEFDGKYTVTDLHCYNDFDLTRTTYEQRRHMMQTLVGKINGFDIELASTQIDNASRVLLITATSTDPKKQYYQDNGIHFNALVKSIDAGFATICAYDSKQANNLKTLGKLAIPKGIDIKVLDVVNVYTREFDGSLDADTYIYAKPEGVYSKSCILIAPEGKATQQPVVRVAMETFDTDLW